MLITRNLGKKYKGESKEFWALHEISLEIQAGETVGLVGLNASGKSTLLKLLARVTWPTVGRIELSGRVGALLEVGTGFHMELTGRENVYLSGAILGMRRSDVKRHFDEIIAFSGIEEFIDTPVKRYSSGMFLRLAFSVMAHLNSEILIVDEILAIGDQTFQKKCLQKMQKMADEGRAIILVSHQMANIRSLCSRVIWLEKGQCKADGETEDILERYECKAVLQHFHPVEG
jgi:lipopolysaccharide transport system ATP-binding protein